MNNSEILPANSPVRIGVVGHANTGKTSLIRTLLRDSEFGDVADYAGTTLQVEAVSIKVNGKEQIQLYDTPGLEDSLALMEVWEAAEFPAHMTDKLEKFQYFIEQVQQDISFDQETKVLKQALASDLLLYVIDVRLPFLGKFQDELTLLKQLGKPLIPILNFINAHDAHLADWRSSLKGENLHAMVEYDTVAFTLDAEQRLYEKMRSLLESRYQQFDSVLKQSKDKYQERIKAGVNAIVDMLVDTAAYRELASDINEATVVEDMQNIVRHREQNCVEDLLDAFGFKNDDVVAEFLPIKNGRWERDIFDKRALKEFGVKTSTDAAKGAVLGGGIDLMVGGLSMGAGAALGAIAGALWGTANRYGRSIWEAVSGTSYVCIDDATIELLYLRQVYLCRCLMQRGHAAQSTLLLAEQVHTDDRNLLHEHLPDIRRQPAWSKLPDKNGSIFVIPNEQKGEFKRQFSHRLATQLNAI